MTSTPKISPIDGLVDLACRDGVDVRPTLLRVITDLYVQKASHSAEETTQYVELALGLIDTVDEATRAAVAARLSQYRAAPAAVLARLGLESMAQEHLAASQPTPIPEPHAEAIERMDRALPDVDFALTVDPPATRATQTGALQPHSTTPIADATPTEVFFGATPGERRLIVANLDVVADPTVLAVPASPDIVSRLEEAALRREPATFARHLETALGIRRDLALRVAEDNSGEPIVIAARALGISAAVLQRILLFLNPAIGQSVERVFDLAVFYDEISLSAASHLVTLWRQDAPAKMPKPRHEPVYQEDARTVRGSAARESRRAKSRDRTAAHKSAR